jgi:cyclic pyranopterin phosphate synthase
MNGYTLRVSVLDHCQLRCKYCLPEAFPQFLSKKLWLSLSHYQKIALLLRRLPLAKIRFTGGEPLLRPDLPEIIRIFAQALPEIPLALTTNGLSFKKNLAHELKRVGLRGITFHLDTLKEQRYEKIMGKKGQVAQVLQAITTAQCLDLAPKINTVVQKHINDDELLNFLLFSQKINSEVRFIEIMNTGSAMSFAAKNFISGQEILSIISKNFHITPQPRVHKSDPAERFFIKDLNLYFGLIASDTRPFCAHCTRLRLSANGRLHTCLYDNAGTQLNFNEDEEHLWNQITAKIDKKISLHPLSQAPRRIFSMSQIGG